MDEVRLSRTAEKKNATEYAIETIEEIRKYSKRPIIVRFHRVISDTQEQDFKVLSLSLIHI